MTLRTALENFLNHVETLEAKKKEGRDLYEKEFKLLKVMTENLRTLPQFSCKQGEGDVNRKKNRYKDIVPYDYTRVILSSIPGVQNCDYINASYIKGASGSMAYIASQGPLASTVGDFWRLIWECDIQVIIMACNEIESGKQKCEKYWPDEGEERQFANITIKLLRVKQICAEFIIRTMAARKENDERIIVQFHYVSWPDHGIPDSVKPILKMVELFRDQQASETIPILVHCSAGCGRTGTICAIDFVWGLLRTGKLTDSFSLFQLVLSMRKQRIAMVQTKDQYVLVYRAVKELFEQHLKLMDSHLYENIDFLGTPISLSKSDCKFIDEEDYSDNYLQNNLTNVTDNDVSKLPREMNENISKNYCKDFTSTNQPVNNSRQEVESNFSTVAENSHESTRQNEEKHHHYENISVYSSSASVSPSQSELEIQDQLERAVVLRKPSIARLRAIFEKPNSPDDDPQEAKPNLSNIQPKNSKKHNKSSHKDLKSPTSKKSNETRARYRDTALRVYTEFRKRDDESEISPLNENLPALELPSSPEFIRRNQGKRNSIHRTSSSIWYDEGNENKKSVENVDKEKPELPVKRSKSMKVTPPKDTDEEASVNGQQKDRNLDLPLAKGIVKLKSSPWNPRRFQSNKSPDESKSPDGRTKDKNKSWYLFGDKQPPEIVAGSGSPSVQLVRVKSNADEFRPSTVPRIVETKEKSLIIVESDDKPPPLPIKTCSPLNSPRIRHQQISTKASGHKVQDCPKTVEVKNIEKSTKTCNNIVEESLPIPSDLELSKDHQPNDFIDIKLKESREKVDGIGQNLLANDSNVALSVDVEEESYQDIIASCQEYLKTAGGYSNVFPKMCENINLIGNPIETNPRGGFVDERKNDHSLLASSPSGGCLLRHVDSSPVPEEFYMAEDVQQLLREIEADGPICSNQEDKSQVKSTSKLKKDYEHLWLSRSGQPSLEDLKDDNGNESNVDLSSYKLVQEILKQNPGVSSTKNPTSSDYCDYIPVETSKKSNKSNKPRKPQPLPRKNIATKVNDVDLEMNFSSESNDETESLSSGKEFTNPQGRNNSKESNQVPGIIYSEICKDKVKAMRRDRILYGSKDDMDLTLAASNKLKRQFSFQLPKSSLEFEDDHQWRHTLPNKVSIHNKNVKSKEKDKKWGEDWDSDEDCTPPVPEKTKEAYMLPEKSERIQSQRESSSSEKSPVSTTNRSFSKFGILSKFGIKMEKIEHKESDGLFTNVKPQPAIPDLTFINSSYEASFPNRLPIKPRGPRPQPVEWSVSKTTIT